MAMKPKQFAAARVVAREEPHCRGRLADRKKYFEQTNTIYRRS